MAPTARHCFLLFLLLLLPSYTKSLDLTSHCTSLTSPGECPCSAHQLTSPSFCLSPISPTTCRQSPCQTRYVCDCAGTTLCRARIATPPLACMGPIAVDGSCKCGKATLRVSTGAHPTILVPLRKFRPVRQVGQVFPKGSNFCTERPAFWATRDGRQLLDTHWNRVVASEQNGRRDKGMLPLFRFGHQGHEISFSSASQMSKALSDQMKGLGRGSEDVKDESRQKLNDFASECAAAAVNVRLASHGVGTRRNSAPPAFDVASRMILQACPHLPSSNPAVGMSVERVMQSAMSAIPEAGGVDNGMGLFETMQACRAINRNFEGCQVDIGCFLVVS